PGMCDHCRSSDRASRGDACRLDPPLRRYNLCQRLPLFQVQPIIAKAILPWFGGTAAVWSTCLVFFPVVLLAGYLYPYCSVRYLGASTQVVVHLVLSEFFDTPELVEQP